MGLLTGHGTPSDGSYVGLDVHRAARIAAAAHGGQILVGGSTRELVDRSLPDGITLRDLGEHRLKDLIRPERLFQVVGDGLPSEFPPLRSLEHPTNLAAPLTSFVGRERELAELRDLLSSSRLVTLTGPGGTGKTRLAIALARQLIGRYEDGAWIVPLEANSDPELVPTAIATALGIRVGSEQTPLQSIEAWAARRELLLVLDNFEQVTAAAPQVSRLLAAAARLHVLVTSRTPLHVYGEVDYPISPLPIHGDAVRLFEDRAAAAHAGWTRTDANAAAVDAICARLDGLPLAIELAAARTRLLSAEQIALRLEDSLSLLASTARDVPERQRTLHAAIDWSYRMLTPAEQRTFTRLGVFRSGIALDAAQAVVGPGLNADVFQTLAELADQSLLQSIDLAAETRFTMLETIRQYADEMLARDAAERHATQQRHAAHFLALATASERELTGINQAAWLDRLDRETANLRAAFAVAADVGLVDEALIAAGAAWRFWQQRGHFTEARAIFDRLLVLAGASPGARAKALGGAGGIAYWQGDIGLMSRCYTEASAIYAAIGDQRGLAEALLNEAYVPFMRSDWVAGRDMAARARDIFEQLGDEIGVGHAEVELGVGDYFSQDFPTKIGHWERAVEIYRRKERLLELADTLNNLAFARALFGQWSLAMADIGEALSIFVAAGNEVGAAMVLEGYGAIAAWVGEPARAARLFGYADATKERLSGGPPPSMVRTGGYRIRAAQALGPDEFERLYADGGSLSQADATALADIRLDPATPPFPGVGGVSPGQRRGL
jgi:predicted ATPase